MDTCSVIFLQSFVDFGYGVLCRQFLASMWARIPHSTFRKKGKPLVLSMFLPIRSVDMGKGDSAGQSMCFHLMTEWWVQALVYYFFKSWFVCWSGPEAYCTWKDSSSEWGYLHQLWVGVNVAESSQWFRNWLVSCIWFLDPGCVNDFPVILWVVT